MGVVYPARDEKLGRQVALKMIRADMREDCELMAPLFASATAGPSRDSMCDED